MPGLEPKLIVFNDASGMNEDGDWWDEGIEVGDPSPVVPGFLDTPATETLVIMDVFADWYDTSCSC